MLDHNDPLIRYVYIFLAALAGGVTALAFMPKWRAMAREEIALTVFVGTTFSLFVVPFIASAWMGIEEGNLRGIVACCYIGAAGAYTFIPGLIRRAASKGDGQ